MFNYDEASKLAAETLDKYNLTNILKKVRSIDIAEVRELLCHFNKEVAEASQELTLDELAQYLHERYGMKIDEILVPYIWWNDRWERT